MNGVAASGLRGGGRCPSAGHAEGGGARTSLEVARPAAVDSNASAVPRNSARCPTLARWPSHNRLQQDSPKTLEEIGKRWGVSRERVRQVELKTKQFLNRYLEPVGGDDMESAA